MMLNMQNRKRGDEETMKMSYPMYTVAAEVLLKMDRLRPHERLMEQGMLVEFKKGMGNAAFVSHQWVGGEHPDPEFKQFQVLQEALRRTLTDLKVIELDIYTESFVPSAKSLPTNKLWSEALFVWYDYFSCPQLEHNGTHYTDINQTSDLALAIESIPAYITKCAFFFVLCPTIENADSSKLFTPVTWAQRGWCRMERACRELSMEASWIMIKSSGWLELIGSPLGSFAFGGPAGEGQFSVEEDRQKLGPVMVHLLKHKLHSLLKAKDLVGYRLLLNTQMTHLGGFKVDVVDDVVPCFEPDPDSKPDSLSVIVSRFFYQNGFKGVNDVDRAGWSPLHYAALNGNPQLIQGLLEQRADLNCKTHKDQPIIGMHGHASALVISLFFKQNKVVRLLLEARAIMDGGLHPPIYCAARASNSEGVRLLCEASCNIHARDLYDVSGFEAAAMNGARTSMDVLAAAGALESANMGKVLFWSQVFRGGQREMVQHLLDLRADVNYQYGWPSLRTTFGQFVALNTLKYRLGDRTRNPRRCFHGVEGTPLMMAVIAGEYEGAAALIAAGADINIRNGRGVTAGDLAQGLAVPDFLAEGLLGRRAECERILSISLAGSLVETKL